MNRPTPPAPHETAPERDALADFVRAHRDQFDADAPPPAVWDAVEAALDAPAAGPQARPDGAPVRHLPHRDVPAAPSPPPEAFGRQAPSAQAFSAQAQPPRAQPPQARIVTMYPYWRKAAVACMLLTIGVLSGLLLSDRLSSAGVAAAGERVTPARELEASYQRLLEERVAEVQRLGPDSALNAELVRFSAPDSQLSAELSTLGAANEHLVLEAMAQEYQAKLDALEHVLSRLRAAEARAATSGRQRATPLTQTRRDTPNVHRL